MSPDDLATPTLTDGSEGVGPGEPGPDVADLTAGVTLQPTIPVVPFFDLRYAATGRPSTEGYLPDPDTDLHHPHTR